MNSLTNVAIATILTLPVALSGQTWNASSPAQNTPMQYGDGTARTGTTYNTPPQANTGSGKSEKRAKVKKSSCVSPPANSGLPDYCKNPYWEPKDWYYIDMQGGGGGRH